MDDKEKLAAEIEAELERNREARQRIEAALEETEERRAVLDNGRFRPSKKPLSLQTSKAIEVIKKEPEWLVPGYIPRGGITTLAGEGGVGKTSIWCALVAAITSGKNAFLLGDNFPFDGGEPQDVLVLSAEDSWSYVLRAKLEANGADLNRIQYISPEDDRFTDLDFNGELLKGVIEQNKPNVIVFDPVQAFVPANLRMGDRNAMRKCFSPLIGYGEKQRITSLIVAHTNKQSGVWGRKRIADSSDIWDASRSVLMVGETPEKEIRYLSQEKLNCGIPESTVLFSLDGGIPVFKGYTTKKDRDFISEADYTTRQAPQREEAKEFILDFLKDGEKEVADLDGAANAIGISGTTLKRAKAELKQSGKIRTWSIGFAPKKWFMSLTASEEMN